MSKISLEFDSNTEYDKFKVARDGHKYRAVISGFIEYAASGRIDGVKGSIPPHGALKEISRLCQQHQLLPLKKIVDSIIERAA